MTPERSRRIDELFDAAARNSIRASTPTGSTASAATTRR